MNLHDQFGYVLNDNSLSGGGKVEDDILGCSHCQAAMHKSVWRKTGAWCTKCDKPLCLSCGKHTRDYGCKPFNQLVDEHVEAQYRQQQLSKMMGLGH